MAQAVGDMLKLFRRTVRAGRDMSVEFQIGRFLSRAGSTQFYFDAGLCARVSKVLFDMLSARRSSVHCVRVHIIQTFRCECRLWKRAGFGLTCLSCKLVPK